MKIMFKRIKDWFAMRVDDLHWWTGDWWYTRKMKPSQCCDKYVCVCGGTYTEAEVRKKLGLDEYDE